VDHFAFLYGKSDEDQPYRKGAAFHRWLLNGYEVPESLLFLSVTKKTFTFIVPAKLSKFFFKKTPKKQTTKNAQ
jgi:nucleosome binding factor SPN SPT16 subunit